MTTTKSKLFAAGLTAAALMLAACSGNTGHSLTIRNVSYDPTREFYQEYNAAFIKHWKEIGGGDVNVEMSHEFAGTAGAGDSCSQIASRMENAPERPQA